MGLVRSRRALLILPFRGKTYYGFAGSGAAVFVSRQDEMMTPLHLRLDLADHSPGGFAAGDSSQGSTQLALAILADWFQCDYAARALYQKFKAAAIAGMSQNHWSLNDDDLIRIFEAMCIDRPWLERLAVLEDGPTVRVVDRSAEHAGEFIRVRAIVPYDESETNDEVVGLLPDGTEICVYRDQVGTIWRK